MILDPIAAENLDRLRPLWLELHAHHQAVAPELAPYVGDAASWAARRALYEHALGAGGFGVIAVEAGADVAYAFAAPEPAPCPATLAANGVAAELLTLVVRPELRGRGVGTRLMSVVEERFAHEGRNDRVIGVVPANARAAALYAARGYLPTWLTLTRFGRPPTMRPTTVAAREIAAVAHDEVDALAPLWHELHRHHQLVAPALAPFVSHEASWAVGRPLLATAIDDGVLVRAGPPESPLGLACATVARDDPLWSDTWATGRDVAETRALVVRHDARGRGIGTALLDAVDERLAALGVADQAFGALAPNAGAIRLCERRGFRAAWLQMTRYEQRAQPA